MRRRVIFLDDGGVMNDNAKRGPQWQQLVGIFLAPRLGGTLAEWARANRLVAERQWADYLHLARRDPDFDVGAYRTHEQEQWLRGMCAQVGVAAPVDSAACVRLADETSAFVTRRVDAAYPGAVEAIHKLHGGGYALHTSSGEHSSDLSGYLEAMGVRDCFGTLYGPDLVNAGKASPRYYARIFSHAGLNPEEALVVDDGEQVLEWAASLGARTVLCGPNTPVSARHHHVASLARLPELLADIGP